MIKTKLKFRKGSLLQGIITAILVTIAMVLIIFAIQYFTQGG